MILSIVLVIFAFIVGIAIGRSSMRISYDGTIVQEVTDAGTKLYSLELNEDLDLDKFDDKKTIIFRMVPPQPTLL